MITVFLGAGFSLAGGVPLASQIFAPRPDVDRVSRQRLVERVEAAWDAWRTRTGGTAEQYLAHLESSGAGGQWHDATWYVSLVIALSMGTIQTIGHQQQPTIVKTGINRVSRIPSHERFWTMLFRHTEDVAVVTTNYDVLPERGLRIAPRPRLPRPGFHYGAGPEVLKGGGYPTFAHLRPVRVEGRIPLLKLHGSVSWSMDNGRIVHHLDCRPAIQGKAIIVAPVTEKLVPRHFRPIWEQAADALSRSSLWLVIGYSFPSYDETVNHLFAKCGQHSPRIHVFNPDESVVDRVQHLAPAAVVARHAGLPDGIDDVPEILGLDR